MQWIIPLVTMLFPAGAFAFFCPNNFKQIDLNYTTDQVIEQCGKPDKQTTTTVAPEGPQEWSYYIPQTVSTTGLTPTQGTLKTQVTFDNQGKAINISVNGIGVGATTICGNKQIQLGDTRDAIKKVCGEPSFINNQNANPKALGAPGALNQVTEFIYNTNPPVTLHFVNGRLESKQ